jgi:hypothetical protein
MPNVCVMTERLTNILLIVGIANFVCLALLVVTTVLGVQNYRMLRALRAGLEPSEGESTFAHSTSNRSAALPEREQRTVRYDSVGEPDRGGVEWTGPVTPYIPPDRV